MSADEMQFPPPVLYLQFAGDSDPDDNSPVRQEDVTWSPYQQFEHDEKYIRASEIRGTVINMRTAASFFVAGGDDPAFMMLIKRLQRFALHLERLCDFENEHKQAAGRK